MHGITPESSNCQAEGYISLELSNKGTYMNASILGVHECGIIKQFPPSLEEFRRSLRSRRIYRAQDTDLMEQVEHQCDEIGIKFEDYFQPEGLTNPIDKSGLLGKAEARYYSDILREPEYLSLAYYKTAKETVLTLCSPSLCIQTTALPPPSVNTSLTHPGMFPSWQDCVTRIVVSKRLQEATCFSTPIDYPW
ncbi:SubName: Full=Uncharacterized protein {ECO:0000313/EMBL:CCA76955.1} [Serendipita indica DSM 11827]|nr:SubName: Full=Uncharacterized protein {ECO:0000313/EMBL:CCA76955.1} [Serendipita indica DSM 11827]